MLAPNEFICPITLSIMEEPVKVEQSGISYEREALVEWVSHQPSRDPKTNVEHATTLRFTADVELKEAIGRWRADPEQADALAALGTQSGEMEDAAPEAGAATAVAEAATSLEVWRLRRELVLLGARMTEIRDLTPEELRRWYDELRVEAAAAQGQIEMATDLPASAEDAMNDESWGALRSSDVVDAAVESGDVGDGDVTALLYAGGPLALLQPQHAQHPCQLHAATDPEGEQRPRPTGATSGTARSCGCDHRAEQQLAGNECGRRGPDTTRR